MKIILHNYEAFFVDYIDGKLNNEQLADLHAFLAQHPDLKAELEEFENFSLEADEAITFDTSGLKKDEKVEQMIIASHENDLSKDEEAELNDLLSKDKVLTEMNELYAKARIAPDMDIIYPDKGKLKRSVVIVYRKQIVPVLAVAASILILVSIFINSADENVDLQPKLSTPDMMPQQLASLTVSGSTFDLNNKAIRDPGIPDLGIPDSEFNDLELVQVDYRRKQQIPIDASHREPYYMYARVEVPTLPFPDADIKKEKSLMGKLLAGTFNLVKNVVNQKLEESSLSSFRDLADSGIERYNDLTGNDIQRNREKVSE